MTETVQPSVETAPPHPFALLLPSLMGMVQNLIHMLPPGSVVQALQARQLLQQMGNATQVMGLHGCSRLMQSMQAPLALYAENGQALADKTGELLQLAARDLQAFWHACGQDQAPSSQDLFASYRALSKLGGKDTAHPCDLWDQHWEAPLLPAPEAVPALSPSPQLRTQLDQHVLALLRTHNPAFCTTLKELCLGLAVHAAQSSQNSQSAHWQLAAAWLEGLEYGLLEPDLYAKRMASRLLAYYASFAKDGTAAPAGMVRELLFFASQACITARQRRQELPALLASVQTQCESATTSAPSFAEVNAAADEPMAAAPGATEVPADTQPHAPVPGVLPVGRPALAPALPEFEAAPEILPAAHLVQGLASTSQMEPDHDFLQQAQSLSDQLEAAMAHWLGDADAALEPSAPAHAEALSRLAWSTGCTEIAGLSHLLQRCLDRMGTDSSLLQRTTCLHAVEEIRRLLHQFAAGFMRRPHPQVMQALQQLFVQLPELQAPPPPSAQTAAPEDVPPADAAQDSEPTAPGALASAQAPEPNVERGTAPPAPAPAPASTPAPAPVLDAMHFSIFEEEMLAVWPQLQVALKTWMQAPQDAQARQHLLRHLHTLKGSARLAGAMAWASQVHALEGLALEVALHDGPRGPASLQQPLEALRIAFVALQQEMAERLPDRKPGQLGADLLATVTRHAQALWGTQEAGHQALQAGQLSLQEIASGLQQLRMQIKDCAAWADTLMLHGDAELPYEWHEELHALVHALNDCTDDLGTAQQQLQHGMADASQALQTHGGHLRALQHTLLYARLRPLSHIQERLSSCVQLAAQDTGKTVDMLWQGIDTLMESEVQQALVPALEHLLRNSVAHGIEDAPTRQAAGKAASGKILIRLHNTEQQQVLSLLDDGAGLHLQAIRDKALALGLINAEDAVDNARAAELIQHPGLSTARMVTELAGRGIGMDVVADTIASLGGTLKITSTAGKGCRFDISLPAPPHVEQVLALRAGSWRVALLARSLEAVRRIPADAADQALSQGVLQDDVSGPLPLYWAGAVWQQSRHSLEPPLDGMRQLLIVRSDTSRWGVLVDEVLGTQEVTLQPPSDLKVPIPGLLGTAVQPTGQVLQVYEASAVLTAHEQRLLTVQEDLPPAPATAEPVRPLVLVADDSLSVRRLAQHLLQSQGYRVTTAADGLEALQALEAADEAPSLLIADIEMPDMDGMELLRRVRADSRWKQLPVVMLTAHSAGPVSQKAIDLGAQAFLTKPYSPSELLAQVRRYGLIGSVAAA